MGKVLGREQPLTLQDVESHLSPAFGKDTKDMKTVRALGQRLINLGLIASAKMHRVISAFTRCEWITSKTVSTKLAKDIQNLTRQINDPNFRKDELKKIKENLEEVSKIISVLKTSVIKGAEREAVNTMEINFQKLMNKVEQKTIAIREEAIREIEFRKEIDFKGLYDKMRDRIKVLEENISILKKREFIPSEKLDPFVIDIRAQMNALKDMCDSPESSEYYSNKVITEVKQSLSELTKSLDDTVEKLKEKDRKLLQTSMLENLGVMAEEDEEEKPIVKFKKEHKEPRSPFEESVKLEKERPVKMAPHSAELERKPSISPALSEEPEADKMLKGQQVNSVIAKTSVDDAPSAWVDPKTQKITENLPEQQAKLEQQQRPSQDAMPGLEKKTGKEIIKHPTKGEGVLERQMEKGPLQYRKAVSDAISSLLEAGSKLELEISKKSLIEAKKMLKKAEEAIFASAEAGYELDVGEIENFDLERQIIEQHEAIINIRLNPQVIHSRAEIELATRGCLEALHHNKNEIEKIRTAMDRDKASGTSHLNDLLKAISNENVDEILKHFYKAVSLISIRDEETGKWLVKIGENLAEVRSNDTLSHNYSDENYKSKIREALAHFKTHGTDFYSQTIAGQKERLDKMKGIYKGLKRNQGDQPHQVDQEKIKKLRSEKKEYQHHIAAVNAVITNFSKLLELANKMEAEGLKTFLSEQRILDQDWNSKTINEFKEAIFLYTGAIVRAAKRPTVVGEEPKIDPNLRQLVEQIETDLDRIVSQPIGQLKDPQASKKKQVARTIATPKKGEYTENPKDVRNTAEQSTLDPNKAKPRDAEDMDDLPPLLDVAQLDAMYEKYKNEKENI